MLHQHEFGSNVGILPTNIKPVNYHLALSNLEYGGRWRYDGSIRIDAAVLAATNEIVLNAKDLDIQTAHIIQVGSLTTHLQSSAIGYIGDDGQLRLEFPEKIPAGPLAFTIKFKGTINNTMAGFYRAKYDSASPSSPSAIRDGTDSYMLVTHFEPCDARRAFPCFDEPHLKASFQLEVELPEQQEVLSNMPILSISPGTQHGFKRVLFEKTPVMSTYLASWAIGDFDYIEKLTNREHNGKRIPVRVYTARGLAHYGRFALEHASAVLDYFAEAFGVDYPLPKCDHIAVPEFISGAMENWGLIIYRTTKILFDEKTSDNKLRLKVAYVVAHELAHQWFGNLVTMNWWNEIWLNEGFATWAGYLAVGHLHPEWKIWTHFTANVMQQAFSLDALRASHPVEVPVESFWDAEQIFDDISYFKGSSVIRMISDSLGSAVFLTGISKYLNEHAYATATAADLYDALGQVSQIDIAQFMKFWIQKPGFPVVEITEESNHIVLQQRRFFGSGEVESHEDKIQWCIPLGDRKLRAETGPSDILTARKTILHKCDTKPCILNPNQSAFYHTKYSADGLNALCDFQAHLSVDTKIGLIRDLCALVVAGEPSPAELLTFLLALRDEGNFFILSEKVKCLSMLESIFASNKVIRDGLQAYKKKLISEKDIKIQWDNQHQDYLTIENQRLYLELLIGVGDENTCSEAQRRLSLWQSGDTAAIDPSFRSIILGRAVAQGGEEAYRAVKEEYLRSTSVDGKEICLEALGRVKEPAVTQKFLDFVISEEMPLQNAHIAALALGNNDDSRQLLWEYVKKNWAAVYGRLSQNLVVLNWWIEMGLSHFSDLKIEQDIISFFADKDVKRFQRSLMVASDSIKRNASFKRRSEQEIQDWLQKNCFV